jgi:hypothetical protein
VVPAGTVRTEPSGRVRSIASVMVSIRPSSISENVA